MIPCPVHQTAHSVYGIRLFPRPVHQTARSVYGIFQTAQSQQAQSGRNSPSGCAAQPALSGRPAYSPTALPPNTKATILSEST